MSEQQSQKRGVVSEAQKLDRARDGYEPIPATSHVAGAFGDTKRDTPTDPELALKQNVDDARSNREQE